MSIPGPPGGQYAAGQPRDPRQGRHPHDPNQGGQPHAPNTRPAVDPWGQGGAPAQDADGADPHQTARYPLPPRYPAPPQQQMPAQYPMPPGHPTAPPYQRPVYVTPPQYQAPQSPVPPQYQAPQPPVPPQYRPRPESTGHLPTDEMPTQYLQRLSYGEPPAPVAGPPEQPRRRGRGLVPALVAVTVLVGGAVAAGTYLTSNNSDDDTSFRSAAAARPAASSNPATGAAAQPVPPVTAQPAPSRTASSGGDPAGSAGATGANDAATAKIGDCLVNDGTDSAPEMRKVDCVKDSYEVLKRFPGTTDKTRCNGTPGYTHNYFFESSVSADSFVLCLKQRT
ncbi:hypothetical protein HC031_03905 [Planosporangium thailandense]|uniref:Uncharacterized protein n=1 Tax=Planosporangium thailandense TaxID=765197 RepID=A0ABX0XUH2_9ACTN|nr:hypothetical protein [Planosporangium thailandense]NJC68873.1 hypothetical protein [Planosporangium thailandense]